MKQKIFLDTSILISILDARQPLRQYKTEHWLRHTTHKLFISDAVISEISNISSSTIKNHAYNLIDTFKIPVIEVTEKDRTLARTYLSKKVFPEKEYFDSLHVSVAINNQIEILASWNYKHLVNPNSLSRLHKINQMLKLPIIEIVTIDLLEGGT